VLDLATNPAFAAYALASSILSLQLIVLALLTGLARGRTKTYVQREDAATFKGEKAAVEHPDVARAQRSHLNTLENAVPFFVVGLLYVLTGATRTGATAYFGVFVAARILHSVVYALGLQPWRTIAYLIGILSIVGMAVHVIRAVA
jgi:microsomal prostaglandin-E synthase 1